MSWENFTAALPYGLCATALLFGLYLAVRWAFIWWSPSNISNREAMDDVMKMLPSSSRSPTPEEIDALLYIREQENEDRNPHCPCGLRATHALPRLHRERMDGKQAVYAASPRYRRVVHSTRVFFGLIELSIEDQPRLQVCESHAHMADAKMDNFIYTDIRAEQSKTNERIAQRAADFETEKMLQAIKDSLTEDQKKKVRAIEQKIRRSPLQMVANGGTPSERPSYGD